MSMSLNLEASDGATINMVRDALKSVNYLDLEEHVNGFSAYLPDTNVRLFVTTSLDNTSVLAEEYNDVNWNVKLRVFFYFDATRHNALNDIKVMVARLAEKTSFDFVLSLHYESIYAVKKLGRFCWKGD